MPKKDSIVKSALILKAVDAARNWSERLDEGKWSIVKRSDLNVELIQAVNHNMLLINDISELSELQRQVHLSEFSRLNNLFNNSKSDTMQKRIQQDPQLLVEYHKYFEEHKRQWDFDPLEAIAAKIRGLKIPITRYTIGDFGCGKARLAELLKENKMYSFDFDKIINDRIVPCDMKSVPLENWQLDIAVFCQSLMEENWREYILEARRCLTKNGLLYIVETTKSLTARLCGLREILKEQGFEINSDEQTGTFTFIEARRL